MSEAAVLTRPQAYVSKGGSILIIDDEAGIRESLHLTVASAHWNDRDDRRANPSRVIGAADRPLD